MPLYWIALNNIKGLGPVKIKRLLSYYKAPEVIFKQSPSELRQNQLFSEAIIKQLFNPELLKQAEKQLKWAQSSNIQILTLNDENYPLLLKEIFAPPPILYVKGAIKSFPKHCIGIVGMRKSSTYGRNVVNQVVGELVENRVCIVSGLALGIDSSAHKTCLEKRGITIAVLGCGVDRIYPASNKDLAEKIENTGAIISEFPLGTPPLPYHFPQRNRIISGLSSGVLVVEAGERSGSLITAHYAIQQGRDVYAIPGSIFSDKSIGTFKLIKEGAIPVHTAKDILENMQISNYTHSSPKIMTRVVSICHDLLSSEERIIMDTISDMPQRIDQIIEKSGKNVDKLFPILLNLELKGVIQQVAGQQYIRL